MAFQIKAEHKHILRRLYLDKRIGEKHTAIEHLKRSAPSHARGDIDKAAKDLLKEGFLLPKTTSYGKQVSLNPNLIPAIEKILGLELD